LILVSTFGYDNLIRSCLLYNELSRSLNDPFNLSIKIGYRTLNTRLNDEIDLLVDEFVSNSSSSNFIICPTRISDLCLQPELILCDKINTPLWNCSLKDNERKFHLLFYRFIENNFSLSIEYDLFNLKHPKQINFLNIINELNNNNKNNLLLRILIEYEFIYKKLKINTKTKYFDEQLFFENFDGNFWLLMKQYFLQVLSS